jgi:hypothetical protein
MIYDYLYYKAYKQAERITDILSDVTAFRLVLVCFMMNYFSILVLISITTAYNPFELRFLNILHILVLVLFGIFTGRESYHNKVVNKYNNKPTNSLLMKANPLLIILSYLFISTLIFAILTMYKGKWGFFV